MSLALLLGPLASAQPIELDAQLPFIPQGRPLEGLVITIDAGHGGSAHEGGYAGSARGVESNVVEGDLNMLVAGELTHHLKDAGAEVHMTRLDDRKVTLGDTGRSEELGARVQVAVETRSHLFVALHHNSTGRRTADGVVVMIWPTDSAGNEQPLEKALADILHDEVEKKVHHAEEFKPYVNEHPLDAGSDIPSAVIEFGFLSNPEFDAWVSQRGSHRAEAIGVYNGVVRMWKEHRDDLEALRSKLFPDLAAETAAKAKPKSARRNRLIERSDIHPWVADLSVSLWPSDEPPKTVEDARRLLETYRYRVITDSTFFYLKPEVSKDGDAWVLRGKTNQAMLRDALTQLFKAVGCEPVRNEMEVLPSDKLGEKKYGVVQIPMAMTWGSPKEGDDVQTQLLLGERVFLLDATPDETYYLVHGGDGYIGWVRREAIRRMDAAEFAQWETARRATVVSDYLANDFRLPTGAALPILSGDGSSSVTLRLPKGVTSTGTKEEVRVPASVVRFPKEISAGRVAAQAATEFLTTPYVFGGRSRLGLDCSGLVGVSYAAAGLTLPRDAKQQVLVGQLIATPWHIENLQPGDVLFFLDETGKVFHTGISLGGKRFIHASPPEVQVSSLDPADSLYSKEWAPHFALARRPLPD
ncbi:MAG: N-acetylmuramoyl-L-alanine amidase [bacterium]